VGHVANGSDLSDLSGETQRGHVATGSLLLIRLQQAGSNAGDYGARVQGNPVEITRPALLSRARSGRTEARNLTLNLVEPRCLIWDGAAPRRRSEMERPSTAAATPRRTAMSVAQVARETSLSRGTIYNALRRRDLVGRKVGKRLVILAEDFDRWLSSLPTAKIGGGS
jgi:excisionase family DNA binding protein